MYKKIILIAILSMITGLVILNLVKTKDIEVKKTQKQVNNTNMLTMMLETEEGTGNYEETTASEWPQDGYIFNESLSRCENGGTLSWDDNAKKVILNTNVSDKCYVYFDVYSLPKINNVTASNISTNSITINVQASGTISDIEKYYYAINETEYMSSTENFYTFNGLTAGVTYNLKIYVVDKNGIKSDVYNLDVATKSCINYLAVGTELESVLDSYSPSTGTLHPTYETSGFVNDGGYMMGYLTSLKFSNVKKIKESYYTSAGYSRTHSYEMGTEYALYNDYLIIRTGASSTDVVYSYKLDMGDDYCDLCINGYAFGNDKPLVLDCNDENWWKKYDEI